MYQIEKTNYGFKLTFAGLIKQDEMQQWLEESRTQLATAPASFQLLVDMQELKPLPPESQTIIEEGQKLYKQKGMQRSVVILNSAVTKMQFTRIAKETGIYDWERYIDASSTPNWEKVATDWLINATDPDVVCCS